MYWECDELIASADFPNGVPEVFRDPAYDVRGLPFGAKPSTYAISKQDLRNVWSTLVESYAACAFSHLSDRVIALADLVERIGLKQEDVYLAGLWKDDLISQLCWIVNSDHHSMRASKHFTPTWAWLSIDGPILYNRSYANATYTTYTIARVLRTEVESKHCSQLLSFTKGELVLRGILLNTRILPEEPHYWSTGGVKGVINDAECVTGREIVLEPRLDEWSSSCAGVQERWQGPQVQRF